jgi:hypothetical protein
MGAMGWLMKIKFYVTLWTIHLSLGSYVHCDTLGHTFALASFRKNLIFSQLFAYFSTLKAIIDSIRPPNSDRNLHVK